MDFVPSKNHSITVTTDVVSTKFQSVAGCVGMEYEFLNYLLLDAVIIGVNSIMVL